MKRQIPTTRRGPLHVIDAAGYSIAGLRRLWQETAARLELCSALGAGMILYLRGVSGREILTFAGLCGLVFLTETLNTAIEVIVDHISPNWSQMAKDAKDLGSLAVAISLILSISYFGILCLTG